MRVSERRQRRREGMGRGIGGCREGGGGIVRTCARVKGQSSTDSERCADGHIDMYRETRIDKEKKTRTGTATDR